MGNKTLLKTRFDSLPLSKYMVSKLSWWAIKFVIKSRLELPEKVSNVPTPFLGVLSYSHGCDFQLSNPHGIPPFWGGGY